MEWDRNKERKAGKAMTIGSCIYGLIFSIVWCVLAASMGAWFMLFFGIPFAGLMAYRLYILARISKEKPSQPREVDPWDRSSTPDRTVSFPSASAKDDCPYCGRTLDEDFEFCPKCGRRL